LIKDRRIDEFSAKAQNRMAKALQTFRLVDCGKASVEEKEIKWLMYGWRKNCNPDIKFRVAKYVREK